MSIEIIPIVSAFVRWTCDDCGLVGDYADEAEQRRSAVQHNSPRTTLRIRGRESSPCQYRQMENRLAAFEKEAARGEAGSDKGTPPGDGRDEPDVDGGAGVLATPAPDSPRGGGLFEAVFTPRSDHESRET